MGGREGVEQRRERATSRPSAGERGREQSGPPSKPVHERRRLGRRAGRNQEGNEEKAGPVLGVGPKMKKESFSKSFSISKFFFFS